MQMSDICNLHYQRRYKHAKRTPAILYIGQTHKKSQELRSSQASYASLHPLSQFPHAPIMSLGRQANTVLTIAITLLNTISTQFIVFSLLEMSLPNNFKWNASGRIMQMEKQATLPRSVMMRSKEGKRIAMTTKLIMVPMRSVILRSPRFRPDMPLREEDLGPSSAVIAGI